jgi:cytochrome P450
VSKSTIATTGRYARAEVTLPNGLVIPKGTFAFSSMQRMWDDDYYPDYKRWDGYRFLNMRNEPGKETRCQLVTTSPEHLGFGHGVHSCPGRFLASNEVKICLSHILLNYDFECVGEIPKPLINGLEFMSNPMARIRVRKRQI